MTEILLKAGAFVAIIVLGIVLRRIGFFKEEDFTLLSRITIRVTLPGAIITSFVGKAIDPGLLVLALLGLGGGFVYMAIRYTVAAALALAFWQLPFDLVTRQALVVLAFSPIGSAIPGFTEQLGGDVGLSSAANSLSIVISTAIIVALLGVML